MALRIVRPICCGMDIHKNIIIATIGITDPKTRITEYHMQQFGTKNHELFRLADWLEAYGCKEVAMESTGKYWIPIWNYLEQDFSLCIANPKYTKAIKGKKTDKKDSKWICDLFKHDLIVASFIPPNSIRRMRELARYRTKLVHMRSSERNRYQNALTASNISLGSLYSDPCGKSATRILLELLNTESENLSKEKINSLVHHSSKNKDTIYEDLLGYEIHSDQRTKLKSCLEHFTLLNQKITDLENELFVRAATSYKKEISHIQTIPGVGPLATILILSEIGADMTQFKTAKRLVSWCGLSPANNESAGKKKSVRISKASQYLKPVLIQCALASLKCKDNDYFRTKYERIKKRRGHKKALIAIARKMIVSIFQMLSNDEDFFPYDLDSENFNKPQKRMEATIENAIVFLKNSGFDTSHLECQMRVIEPPDIS